MAGSKKWVKYTADNGNVYAVKIDESNAELTGFDDITIADEIAGVVPPPLPKGARMRYAIAVEPDSGNTRRIWVGKNDIALWLGSVFSVLLQIFGGALAGQSVPWQITSLIGEAFATQKASASDTGFDDGDDT